MFDSTSYESVILSWVRNVPMSCVRRTWTLAVRRLGAMAAHWLAAATGLQDGKMARQVTAAVVMI